MREPERPSWECGCPCDHYETGAGRAWCSDCSEWCYPDDPDMLCLRGREGHYTAEIDRLRNERDALLTIVARVPLTYLTDEEVARFREM